MKAIDFLPRIAPFDELLRGKESLIGVEVGVDGGAHAEAMLQNLAIKKLFLIDTWESPYAMGYTAGRLETKGYSGKYDLLQMTSISATKCFNSECLDFVYLDSNLDYDNVLANLHIWWTKVKRGGLLCQRNYTGGPLKDAVDYFVKSQGIETKELFEEIALYKNEKA